MEFFRGECLKQGQELQELQYRLEVGFTGRLGWAMEDIVLVMDPKGQRLMYHAKENSGP